MPKSFILDTNVILYDPSAIYNFQDNDIIIPITVLEELDKLKSGNATISVNARHFIRELDNLIDKMSIPYSNNSPIPLGEGLGNLYIKISESPIPSCMNMLELKSNDNWILGLAYNLQNDVNPVILVSKDINLRLKALAFNVKTADYETGKVKNLSELYKGFRVIEDVREDTINDLYKNVETVELDSLIEDPTPNEYFLMRGSNKQSIMLRYNKNRAFEQVINPRAAGIAGRNLEQIFALDALLNPDCSLVTLTGLPGGGKTLLALAAAIHQKRHYTQILLARPLIPLSNQGIGFLPGDINEKIDPYMQPLYDNLKVIKEVYENKKAFEQMTEEKKIEIAALPFLRGRSLPKVFFIIDEAQNLTPHEIKTIVTRAGEDTKVVFTGDIYQIDSPYLDSRSNGLSYLISKMRGQDIYAHVNLEKSERSKLAELAANLL